MHDFSGEFDTHLTVAPPATPAQEHRLRAWAERHRARYTRIVLDRGATPDQPMLTTRGTGTLPATLAAAADWSTRLRAAGFLPVRVKIEAAPWNAGVPQTAAQALALPPGLYFEHHVKLHLPDESPLPALRAIADRHSAQLSRNARRDLGAAGHHRFLTQRRRATGRPAARRDLDALLADLAAAGHHPIEVEEEFVVHDDHPALDTGWITERTAPGAPDR